MIEVKAGWAYIQWSLDTYDWRGISTANVMNKVKSKLTDGDIILCHDIKDHTPESTRQIVHYLEEAGYMPLTIDELFAKDGVELEPNKVYFRCFQGDTSIRKRIEYDLYYIENWTVGLDIKIILMTFFKGFINKNAY